MWICAIQCLPKSNWQSLVLNNGLVHDFYPIKQVNETQVQLLWIKWQALKSPQSLVQAFVGCNLGGLSSRAIVAKFNQPKPTVPFILQKWKMEGHCQNVPHTGGPKKQTRTAKPLKWDSGKPVTDKQQQEFIFPSVHCASLPAPLFWQSYHT